MKKKIGLLTLALLSFGLVACGGESTPTEGPATDTPTEQPTEKPTETPVIAVLTINVSGEKKVGEVITFVAFLDGSPLTSQSDVTYTCSDAEAMEINGNKATLLKAGTFTVNAAHKNGAKASVELTIEEGQKLLTIAEAKQANDGTLVHIQGKITASAGTSAFIADETGGMYIYNWWYESDDTAVNDRKFTAGDSVDMVAQVATHEGGKQLTSYDKNKGAAIDGCYAKKLDTEVASMTPINLDETVLKSLTKASIGDVYTFEAAYVSEKTQGGLHTVDLKMGETTFALASNGSTRQTSSYDPDFADLKVRFDALQLEEGDVIKVTTPFASVYNGTNQFAFFSQGTKFERVTPLTVKTVTIDGEETRNLVVGDTLTLTAAVAPSSFTGGVTWSSSNEAAATVTAAGVVTAVGAGTATITATSVDNPAVSDTVTINVTAAAVPATSVTLDKTEATLYPSQTVTLTATIAPENTTDTITWSSSDAAVATVADGVVTAVAAGTAIITAKANDEAVATCTITVVEFSTISEIKNGNSYYLKGVVSAKNTKAFVLSDATGSIYTYTKDAPSVKVGDVVTVKATASEFKTCLQLSSPEVNVVTGETGTIEEATPLTAEVATAWADGTHNTIADNKKYSWRTTIGKTGNYYLLPVEGSSTVIEPAYLSSSDFPLIEGREYDVEAFYTGYTGSYAQMVITKAELVPAAELSVALNKETASVRVGEQVTLTAIVSLPAGVEDESVTWTSSNEAVATVANGVVTGLTAGTTTITATSVADPTKSASCVVTVETAFEAKTFAKVTNTADIAVGDTVTLVCPLAAGAKVAGAFNSGNYYDGLDVTVSENSFQSLADMTTFSIEA
ncbi:MAG: Ig-like domain-containing protein, partial [Candidatus Enterosoma sp.]|nr:Ig-like domain-containing protein [Candidatus Enterosoma sp.]